MARGDIMKSARFWGIAHEGIRLPMVSGIFHTEILECGYDGVQPCPGGR
jgi:hypothetical protein